MDFVANPLRLALTTIARLKVIGRLDEKGRGRLRLERPRPYGFMSCQPAAIELLHPNTSQDVECWQLTQVLRRICGKEPIQQLIAITPDTSQQRLALTGIFGQAGRFST